MSKSKTSVWHKQLLWTPPARYVNREGKRLACEKHMDWWPASTKPLLQPYAIQKCSTIALTKVRLHMSLAARFLTRDVAQMVEPPHSKREVQESMPRNPIFQRTPENKKRKYGKLFCQTKRRHGFGRPICEKKASKTVQSLLRKWLVSRITKVYLRKTSEETLLYWWVNQRHPSDINSSFGPHQRGMSIGRASDWHVRNTWIDDQHRQSQFFNHMQYKTVQPLHWQKKGFICH